MAATWLTTSETSLGRRTAVESSSYASTSSRVLCVPSICELSTASRLTYIATNRSGLGNVRPTPSRRPIARLASERTRDIGPGSAGGSGGSSLGTKRSEEHTTELQTQSNLD